MLKNALLVCLFALAITGCRHQYTLVLNNGMKVTANEKPKLDHGFYTFKDSSGRPVHIPASRVQQMAPSSMIEDDRGKFKGAEKK